MNRKHWFGWLVVLAVVASGGSGCFSTRGVVYLQRDRVQTYLASQETSPTPKRDAPPPARPGDKTPPAADSGPAPLSAKDREWLKTMPEGNKILGGYCNDGEVQKFIGQMEAMGTECVARVNLHRNRANINGGLYWGFLGGTIAFGAAMIVGGLVPTDNALKAGLAVGFGIPTLVLALTNTLGGFDGRQEVSKRYARQLDNYLWSLRSRVISEICNAPSIEYARREVQRIYKTYKVYCGEPGPNEGLYEP